MNNVFNDDYESTQLKRNRANALMYPFDVIDDETELPVADTFTRGFFTVKKRKTDPDSQAVFQNPVIFTDGTHGEFYATAEQMDIPAGIYYYDLKLISPTTGAITLINDTLTVIQTVTEAN